MSLNQRIATAVAQKIGVVETTAEFLRRRAGNATGSDLSEMVRHVPDREPDLGDESPLHVQQRYFGVDQFDSG